MRPAPRDGTACLPVRFVLRASGWPLLIWLLGVGRVEPHCPRQKIFTHIISTAFMPPAGGGGPGEEGKPGNGFWGMLGKLLTAGAARVALAGAVASLAMGLQLAPPGSFQLYHTVGEIPAVAFREVRLPFFWTRASCSGWVGGCVVVAPAVRPSFVVLTYDAQSSNLPTPNNM